MGPAGLFDKRSENGTLKADEDKVKAYREYAVQAYEQLVERFPESEYAPMALSQMGTVWTMLEKPDEAEKALSRLQKEYPETQAANCP